MVTVRRSFSLPRWTARSAFVLVIALVAYYAVSNVQAADVLAEFRVSKGGEPLIVPIVVKTGAVGQPGTAKRVYRMLIDTASSGTLFHNSHRAALGEPVEKIVGGGLTGPFEFEAFRAPAMQLGSITVRPSRNVVGCVDMGPVIQGMGEQIDGILGMDVLGGLVVSIDFDRGILRILGAADQSAGTAVPIARDDFDLPNISAVLADGTIELFRVDAAKITSFAGSLRKATYERLVRADHLLPVSPRTFTAVLGIDGVSATAELRRATRFAVARYSHENLMFLPGRDNNLGLAYLSRYKVTFDFPSGAMYLEPGTRTRDPDLFDLSGLKLSRSADGLRVESAEVDRPARGAGIVPGDVITEIDGISTQGITLFASRRMLSLAGPHVLAVRRGAAEQHVVFNLGDSLAAGIARAANAGEGKVAIDRSLVLEEFAIPTDGSVLMVPVKIGDKECRFMVGTGAFATIFDTALKPMLGTPLEKREVKTPLGPAECEFFSFPRMTVGRLPVAASSQVTCLPMDNIQKALGEQVDGMLGLDVLRQYVVRLDFDDGKLFFLKRANPRDGIAASFCLRGVPSVWVDLPGCGSLPAVVDTGKISLFTGTLNTSVFSRIDENDELMLVGTVAPVNAGRSSAARTGMISACSVAEVPLTNTIWSENDGNFPNQLSLYFLTQFNVTIDFANSVMYMSPSRNLGHDDLVVGLSGIKLGRVYGNVVITSVSRMSPAEQCDIRPGDVLKGAGDTDANTIGLFQLYRDLSKPNRNVRLVLERGSERLERDLILPAPEFARKPDAVGAGAAKGGS
jgi:hypothetical protein